MKRIKVKLDAGEEIGHISKVPCIEGLAKSPGHVLKA